MLMIDAYDEMELEKLEHTRLISYTIACTTMDKDKRVEIYDYMPLPNDPSPAKRRKITERELMKKLQQNKKYFTNGGRP